VKIETDHIVPSADGGNDDIDNAIPVCFDCHAEIHSYNPDHPRGRKFTSNELRAHKDRWLDICDRSPQSLLVRPPRLDDGVGPLQALIDEIEFNTHVAQNASQGSVGCPYRDDQFSRAIATGSIAILAPDLKQAIIGAYAAVGRASVLSQAAAAKAAGGRSHSVSGSGGYDPREAATECERQLCDARSRLLDYLGHEAESQ
jgi:hypothetical protein